MCADKHLRLILADDHRLVRMGLRRVLDDAAGLEVVAEAETGEDAIRLCRELAPDIVLMDVNMPGIGGLEATRRILAHNDAIKVIAISMYCEEPYPSRLLGAGARGYLSKDAAADEVVSAIRRVAAGGIYVAAEVAGNLAARMFQGKGADANPFASLSDREMQVMQMLTKGQSNQTISETLNLSPKTVSTYRTRLLDKLNVNNDVELTRLALRYGVLDDGPVET